MNRVGTAADGSLEEVVRAVRDGTAAALRAGRSLAAACRAADRGERSLARSELSAWTASGMLDRLLWDPRREVARPLDLTRPGGPEHDSGLRR